MRSMKMLAAASAATIAVAWAGTALADMTGTYTGYGDGAGATLDIEQVGNRLTGVVAGVLEGALLGETDGGDNATGVVLIFDIAKFPFTGVFTGTELQLTLTGVNGELTLVPFTLDGATTAPVPTPTPPTKPVSPPTPAVTDHATATEALRTLLVDLIGVGYAELTAEARAGLVECLIGVTAPLSAAELQSLVATGFEPTDEMIAQFERTVPGIDAAVGACFDAAVAPTEPVTAPAKPAPAPAPQPAPPPPAPVALDDAVVDANLRVVLVEVVAETLPPDATAERRAAAVECLFLAAAGLPAAERQHLADIGFDPDEEDIARLETLLPGITEAVGTCLGFD